jgi:hypothetical protein
MYKEMKLKPSYFASVEGTSPSHKSSLERDDEQIVADGHAVRGGRDGEAEGEFCRVGEAPRRGVVRDGDDPGAEASLALTHWQRSFGREGRHGGLRARGLLGCRIP